MLDNQTSTGDFLTAIAKIREDLRQSNDAVAEVLVEVFTRLDTFAKQLKGDSDADRTLVKQAVGQAMATLRTELESQTFSQEAKIDARLASIRVPVDGVNAKPEDVVPLVLAQLPPAPEWIPETSNETIEKINKSTLLIAKERVEGLVDAIRQAVANAGSMPVTTSFFNGLRGKNLTIVGGTATQQGDTVSVTVSGSGSNLSLTTTGTSGASTYNSGTGVLNIPVYSAGSGGISRTVSVTSGSFTMGSTPSTDYDYYVAGAHNGTLPTAVSNTNHYYVRNNFTADVTISTTGVEVINQQFSGGAIVTSTSVTLNSGRSYTFGSDGTSWNII